MISIIGLFIGLAIFAFFLCKQYKQNKHDYGKIRIAQEEYKAGNITSEEYVNILRDCCSRL